MPTPPAFGDADFAQAMARLQPPGRAWRTDAGSNALATLQALAPSYTRSMQASAQLLIDTNPDTTQNLLTEWEDSLGLPDPCTPLNPSLQQRQAAVRAKFGARGTLNIAYFVGLAAALGFAITITEFRPFCADMSCDLPDYDANWAFVWQVNAPSATTEYFLADVSGADDPLETNDASELICRITRDKPADTTVMFSFGGTETNLWNNGGLLCVYDAAGYPSAPTGLSAGALWSNGGIVAVVSGVAPNPAAPPVYYAALTSDQLLTLGGGDLPLSNPGPGTKRLWNDGGVIAIA